MQINVTIQFLNNTLTLLSMFIFALSVVSCGANGEERGEEAKAVNLNYVDSNSVEERLQSEISDIDEEQIPYGFKTLTYVVLPNQSGHDTEELKNLKNRKSWVGLFQLSENEIEILPVSMKFKREFDPITDNEKGPFTGIKTVVSPSENCFLTLNPIFGMRNGKIASLLPINLTFLPNESKSFVAGNKRFKVYSTGSEVSENGMEGIRDYKLLLQCDDGSGVLTEQILMKVPTFHEYELPKIVLTFCGFLDGDEFPDFVLRNTDQYYIFLSNDPKEIGVLKCVGTEVIFGGC